MPIHVVGPNEGKQSGGGPIRCRIIEDGTHTQHRLGLIGRSCRWARPGRLSTSTKSTTRYSVPR